LGVIKETIEFIKDVAKDERIPARDKKVVLALLALIVSPLDIIPDWIPIIGLFDDAILLAIVLDYFFDVLDQEIILSHFPWSFKKYKLMRRMAKTVAQLTPGFIKRNIWKFEGSPYQDKLER